MKLRSGFENIRRTQKQVGKVCRRTWKWVLRGYACGEKQNHFGVDEVRRSKTVDGEEGGVRQEC